MPLEISAVAAAVILRFVALPFRLHAGTPWIPPLKLERYLFLTRKLNAFFTHGEAEYFLARRDGRVVGRITAQLDFDFNQYHGSRWGMFGFLEFEDDQEIVDALAGRRRGVVPRRAGCDRMVGPMNFQINDEAGVLIEGFEREPLIREPWNPPYYQARYEQAGLSKAMDLFGWDLSINDREHLIRSCPGSPSGPAPATGSRSARWSGATSGGRWTSSPRSTTPPGRTTGASCPTPRPTSTPTRSTCSSSTRASGS